MNGASILKRLRSCEQGLVFIEFAICVPVLILMVYGAVELTRFALMVQKTEDTASEITEIVVQLQASTPATFSSEMTNVMKAVTNIMNPYTSGASDPNVWLIITDVVGNGANNTIKWSYCGGGRGSGTTRVTASALPDGLALVNNEEVITGEIFYRFQPIMKDILPPITLYRSLVYKPRNGALTTALSGSNHC